MNHFVLENKENVILSNLHSYVSENKENLPQVPMAKTQKKRPKSSPALARKSIENNRRKHLKSNDREENNKEPNWVKNILRYEMVDTPANPPLLSRTRQGKNHQEGNKASSFFLSVSGSVGKSALTES